MNLFSFERLKVLVIKTLDRELKPDPNLLKMHDLDGAERNYSLWFAPWNLLQIVIVANKFIITSLVTVVRTDVYLKSFFLRS